MIRGIAHTALYTDRFDETIEFYEKAFEAVSLGEFLTQRRGCWLKIADDIIEVFESDSVSSEGVFKHIALQCDSVDESYEKALKAGASIHVEPKDVTLEMNEVKHLRIAFVKGINNEQIELCEERNTL